MGPYTTHGAVAMSDAWFAWDEALNKDVHVVTGATSGIGRAIAIALVESGRRVLAIGRNRPALDALAARFSGRLVARAVDLLDDQAIDAVAKELTTSDSRVGALVHCAGIYVNGPLATTAATEIDSLFRSNVRAPFVLTQRLIEPLERAGGHLVFLNSSAGISETAGAGAGAYAAMHHASRVLADTWRRELNAKGIRVLSIYPGRTNTPRMERVFAHEGRRYEPENLLQPDDIAAFVVFTLGMPNTVEMTDIKLRPAKKSY